MKNSEESSNPLWIYPNHSPEWCAAIIKEFRIHPVTAQVLVSRKFTHFEGIHNYLYAKLPNLLTPDLLCGMDKAVARILHALQTKENILIYGDNDVDGITGTVLLVELLRELKSKVYYYIPNRTSTSSTLITDAVEFALTHHCTLFITVDCGMTAAQEIREVGKKKIDVIITDHHEPIAKIPQCVAILNPKLHKSTYPNRNLTGVGVAFKLAHGITNALVSKGEISSAHIDLKRFLDLVALGTVGDMGTLLGENRILVRYGLRQFAQTKRTGLLELMRICEIKPNQVNTTDIASKIVPRLNSLGRISDPKKGVQLLLMHDTEKAVSLAKELDENNIERQWIERENSENIEHYIQENPDLLKDKAFVLYSDKWHPGIIPILAARIAKQYNRPTLIIAIEQEMGKGSIRTIPEFPLLFILNQQAKLLTNFGGHDYAAGLVIKKENIPEFKKAFIALANQTLKTDDIIPKLQLDARIQFEDLTFDFLESLQLLEPYGIGNPAPLLYSDVKQTWTPKVVGKIHLKLYLEQNGRTLEGIGFGMSQKRSQLYKKQGNLQIVFTPHVNVFLNKSSIQLLIKDFKLKK